MQFFGAAMVPRHTLNAAGPAPLRLIALHTQRTPVDIASCAFSRCGKYFAFIESLHDVVVYRFNDLWKYFRSPPAVSEIFDPEEDDSSSPPKHPPRLWIVSKSCLPTSLPDCNSTPTSRQSVARDSEQPVRVTFDMQPICRLASSGKVQCLAFATGSITHCRLPHRLVKRRCRLLQADTVSLLLIGLDTGHTTVYNLENLDSPTEIIPSLALIDGNLPVRQLYVSPDLSLRVASVHLTGDVKLWDLWDDGNMYASLKRLFVPLPLSHVHPEASCCEAYCFAWQPKGPHVCAAGAKAFGVILQSEKPFSRVVTLAGHYNLISSAAYTHDASLLLTTSYDTSCVVWSVPEYRPLRYFWHTGDRPGCLAMGGANGHHVYGVCVAPDDLHFATICEDRHVRLWSLGSHTGSAAVRMLARTAQVDAKPRCVFFSPCGQLLAVSTSSGQVLIYHVPSQLLSLSRQCFQVVRYHMTLALTNHTSLVSPPDRSPELACSTTSLFHKAALGHISLPGLLMQRLLRFPATVGHHGAGNGCRPTAKTSALLPAPRKPLP